LTERKGRCKVCKQHRKTLNSILSRKRSQDSEASTQPTSHTTYHCLTHSQLAERLHLMHKIYRHTKQQLRRTKEKVNEVIEQDGIQLDECMHTDFETIMQEQSKLINDSFQQLLWKQQMQPLSQKSSKAIRWHPLIIKWCIYLQHLSSGACEVLRSSGRVKLPSQWTLRDYTHYYKAGYGFCVETDQQLIKAGNFTNCHEHEKYVIIIMDEMHIKEDLIYNKHNGELIGFVNLGETNSHLLNFKRQMQDTNKIKPLANSMVVFYVRGLFTSFHFPYAQFPCHTVTGELLYEPFWECVSRPERYGLKVLGVTCDGASNNRRFFKLHQQPGNDRDYKIINPFAPEKRCLYFFPDPPT